MRFLSHLSLKCKLGIATFGLVACFACAVVAILRANREVAIQGPLYHDIVMSKDLIADVLPPPAYIIEIYQASHELADIEDASERARVLEELEGLRSVYAERLSHWEQALPESPMKRDLLAGSYQPVEEYFKLLDEKFLPAVKENRLEEARQLVNGRLHELYEAHHGAILRVVDEATKHNQATETAAQDRISTLRVESMAIAIVMGLGALAVSWFGSRKLCQRIYEVRGLAVALAKGDLSHRIQTAAGDELADTANELNGASISLANAVHAMIGSMEAATRKDYKQLINEAMPGDFDRMRVALNRMLETLAEQERQVARNQDFEKQLQAISKSQAVIEFDLQGNILAANDNFCHTMGYSLGEIQGKHHSMFVDSEYARSEEYRRFWDDLRTGNFQSREFKRFAKGGKETWLQASYNPIYDLNGKVVKVVKYATDITASKLKNADFECKLKAISKAQAVIEFTLDGTVVDANDIFLRLMGYELSEIVGRKHVIFVDHTEAQGADYARFWDRLRQGENMTGDFRRVTKSGREVWIRGSYNPIYDPSGRLTKVVKYASDITASKTQEREILEAKERESKQAESLRQRIDQILQVVNAVSEGDFCVQVPDMGTDAVGQMATALAEAIRSMRSALQEVRGVAGTVTTAAEELTSTSQEISSGAQQQASSLEETASSLEQITSTVKQNTDNAQQARQLATGSQDVAEKGGQVVGRAVEAMAAINQSSRKIADIITTIDEIAFQTNLLALNAAVEAARAGEQGRGFAVVAAEVRNLAQRSASAAKEIKSLIQDSVQKVENGTELVNRSGQTLQEIVNSVKRVTDIVAEIAAASREQLAGIEQVNKAVSQMDRVTQANATQTEEMSGTAVSLQNHASQLSELVRRFRLETGGTSKGHGASAEIVKAAIQVRPKTPPTKRAAPAASAGEGGASAPIAVVPAFAVGDTDSAVAFMEF